jgi:REase associating with pPIWI_RE/pPIWI_RE three-gene island domain Y
MEIDEVSLAEAKQVMTHLAVGLLRQDEAMQKGVASPVTALDEQLQWGWDKLAFLCYKQYTLPPRHLPQLIDWLHRPVEDWEGLGPLFAEASLSGPLLSYGAPSELCTELGRGLHLSSDPERELQDTPFKEILAYCQKHHLAEQYKEARLFLVSNPYLPFGGITISSDSKWDPEVRKWLRLSYESIPSTCRRMTGEQECIALCPRCRWPLEWRSSKRSIAVCYNDLCGHLIPGIHDPQRWERVIPEAMRTTRGIQESVVAPEVPLLELQRRLKDEYRLSCDLWPEVDSYDLAVHLSDGQCWAVDMKDYRSPTDLAAKVRGFRPTPKWDRAFFVFPEHRRSPGYLQTFRALWNKPKGQRVEALFVKNFLWSVQEHEAAVGG